MGGFATRAGLLAAGVTDARLRTATKQGRVVRLRRGVYGLGLPDGIEHLRAAAVSLRAVVSHDSAALLWGLELAHQPTPAISVPRNRGRARYRGVQVHRRTVDETEVRDGMRVTTVLRTVLDCAATLTLEDAVVVAESALRQGLVTLEELREAATRVRGRQAKRVRRVVALADPASGSVLETLLRILLVCAGLAPDLTQFTVRDWRGRRIARVDFVYLKARLIVEADGFEFHRERADYRKDRRRANAFCLADWGLLRFSYEDVRFFPDYVIETVRQELAKPARRVRRPRDQSSTRKAA